MNDRDLDMTLERIHAELRRPPAPSALRSRIVVIPATAGRRRWFLPSITPWRPPSMLNATKFVVAGVIVALFGGFLLAGPLAPTGEDAVQAPGAVASATLDTSANGTLDTSAPSTQNDSPGPEREDGLRLPEDLPEGVPSGSIAAGPEVVRWVHLTSDLGAIPDEGSMVATADGIAVHDRLQGTLMHTEDGVSWLEVPSPSESWHGRVAEVDGAYWFIEPGSGRLWRSSDLFEWQELEASVLRSAIPKGWKRRDTRVSGPVTVNGEVTFWVDYDYSLPRRALGLTEPGASLMQQVAERHYWLCVDKKTCRERKPARDLMFKRSDVGLRVLDRSFGKQLGILEGATYDDLYEGRMGTKGVSFVVSGDTATWGPHPRPAAEIDMLMREQPPDFPPAGADAVPLGSRWFASELEGGYSSNEAGERWIHAGGEWVSLAGLGLPGTGPDMRDPSLADVRGVAAPGKNGLGDVALLWYGDGDARHLWVLTVESAGAID